MKNLPRVMAYHLCACCDGSFIAATKEAGIGVLVVLVNYENVSDFQKLLYAWKKTNAERPDIAELKAIRFACFCLDRDDVKGKVDAFGAAGLVRSGAVRNDCESVVCEFRRFESLGSVQEIFRRQYACDISIEWESNHSHRKEGLMAVVDEMAKAARVKLEVGETVFSEDVNGLSVRGDRAVAVDALLGSVERTVAGLGPEGAETAAGSGDVDVGWNGRGGSSRLRPCGRNEETGALRRSGIATGSHVVDADWKGRGRSIRPDLCKRNDHRGAFRMAHVESGREMGGSQKFPHEEC